jgi:hypothetical protein
VSRADVRTVLGATWWIVFPCFAVLTVRLAHDRACGNAYLLLPDITSTPSGAWPLATIYLLAHVWMVTAWVLYVLRSNRLVPPVEAITHAWRGDERKVLLMAVAFAIEYAPIPVWHALGRLAGCG